RIHSMLFQQRCTFGVWVRGLWSLWRKLLKVHADGKGPDHGEVFVSLDREMFPVNPGFQSTVDGLQEVVAVGLNGEADQVRSQQSIEQLTLPWADTESFRIGPRNMPKDRHTRVGTFFLNQPRYERKVIVLHQHYRMFDSTHFLQNGRCKLSIDLLIV